MAKREVVKKKRDGEEDERMVKRERDESEGRSLRRGGGQIKGQRPTPEVQADNKHLI